MPAKWVRLEPIAIPVPGMLMATAAGKHVVVFKRARKCRIPPGRFDVKAKFKEAAHTTGGLPLRSQRIGIVKEKVLAAGLKTGILYKRSHSKYTPLAGKFYEIPVGGTVSAEIARKGLEAILKATRPAGR